MTGVSVPGSRGPKSFLRAGCRLPEGPGVSKLWEGLGVTCSRPSRGESWMLAELCLLRPSHHARLAWLPLCLPLQVFHEQGILFGYRHPQSSATACVLSLFQMTNETLNIWTHLLPFCFFTWRFVSVLRATDIPNDSYSWPLLVYMGASCVYPLASSCAHTFSCMSGNARHICYFLDYGAVSLFSLGTCGLSLPPGPRRLPPFPLRLWRRSAIAYSAYVFPDSLVRSTFHDYYVGLAVLSAVMSTGLSCYSRYRPRISDSALQLERLVRLPLGKYFFRLGEMSRVAENPCFGGWPSPARAGFLPVFLEIQKPRLCKLLRILAFAYPYTWDSLPIFSRLFLLPGGSAQNEATLYHQKHMAMTLLASFFYSAHLPERLAPGRFDYIGECGRPGQQAEEDRVSSHRKRDRLFLRP
ncbi:Membrane progestin receptor gamma [Camelus dromedarius]|uniref:Membrane progestin receptor gamma n=1 Tax=Camelus dromedarius TaxID=9838 RepID=A0A5N4CDX3_CAMDR|nr:Membrane progestin receptor gamma [Camelus dromedarius]